MDFKTQAVRLNGSTFKLRELSAGALEAVDTNQSEYTQGLTMLALSLCDESGAPLFAADKVGDALAHVRAMPVSAVRSLQQAALELNAETLDHARGN